MHKFPKPAPWAIDKFVNQRNNILIKRTAGGLGDILMHRMLFEDFKLQCPEINVHFALPQRYFQAVQDHPFIDKILDSDKIDPGEYLCHWDTTVICGRTEQINAPLSSPHRSDIWAHWCGITLSKHEMHLTLTEGEKAEGRAIVEKVKNKDGPTVAFCPISAIYSKNLDEQQIRGVVNSLHDLGCFVYGVHTMPILGLETPLLVGKNIRNYMSIIDAADYVIAVDSAAFHVAGALGKKQVGIFSWADGKVYGKYYKNWLLVQRHRDEGWDCGPCYNWGVCPKLTVRKMHRKPCITEVTSDEIVEKFIQLKS